MGAGLPSDGADIHQILQFFAGLERSNAFGWNFHPRARFRITSNTRLPFVHAWLAAAYALKGQQERARAELADAQQLNEGYGNLATVRKSPWFAKPEVRALAEATYFTGLRQAGMQE